MTKRNAALLASPLFLLAVACSSAPHDGSSSSAEELSGCHGTASHTIPSDGRYYLTTFGGGSDTQTMSCGGSADGTWYYAASKQRFGCGAKIQIEANGKCVVAATDDYGPDVCVERAAGRPIIDASPLVAEHLFGTSSAGWSDRMPITATLVDSSTPLGPCSGGGAGGSGGSGGGGGSGGAGGSGGSGGGGAGCHSSTLGRDVPENTCVQSRSDRQWYQCDNGSWVDRWSDPAACVAEYPL